MLGINPPGVPGHPLLPNASLPPEDYAQQLAAMLASQSGTNWSDPQGSASSNASVSIDENADAAPSACPPPPPDIFVRLRDGIDLVDRCIGRQHIVVMHDRQSGKFFHLGCEEAIAVSVMDGKTSISQISQRLIDEGSFWTPEDVQAWVTTLAKSGLAVIVDANGVEMKATTGGPMAGSTPQAAKPPVTPFQQMAKPLSHVISQKISLGSADIWSARLCPILGCLFTPAAVVLWLIGAGVALTFAWSHAKPLGDELRLMFSPAAWPLLAAMWVLLKVLHESGHAVAAKLKSVRVGKFGITFFLFAPIPFVDVTDAWRLKQSCARVQIAMAGVYLEGWTAIAATFAYVILPDGLPRHLAAQWMMMAGPATWLVNANPLLRMDGYYALSDALNIPNLKMHGRRFWTGIVDRLLLGIPRPPSQLVGWRHPVASLHAAASLVFQAVWMSGLVIAVSQWGGPIGFVMSASAAVLWCAVPLGMWFNRHWQSGGEADKGVLRRRLRLAMVALATLSLGGIIMHVGSPVRRSVPVLVQYRQEQVVRAAAAGFVSEVAVHSGQWVRKGDLLVVVTDDELVLRRDQMQDDLELALSKQRQHTKRGELGAAAGQSETIRSLQQSLRELEESLASLQVTAERTGIVISAHPERQLGRYVKRGDVLLRVANPSDKELLVVFPESEWAGYQQVFSANKALAIRLRGGYHTSVIPEPARPRFSVQLPDPSFAGTGGGDIPVLPDESVEGGFRAAFPVGEAVAALSPIDSKKIRSGQRGRMYLNDTRSIAQRLWIYLGGE